MNIIKYSCALSCSLLMLMGCTEDIDLKLNSTGRRLVVEGFLTSDTTQQYIRLTYSGDYFDNKAMPSVKGASVSLATDDETLILTEDDLLPGYYFTPSDFYCKQGKTYHLHISNVDANGDGTTETYDAESEMPYLVKGDSIQIGYHRLYDLWKVLLFAKDPAESENFYAFRASINGTLISNKLSDYEQADDRFFDGNEIDGVWVMALDDGKNIYKNDTLTLDMLNINETFYDYLNAVDRETEAKTPLFSGAPANVPGNISNKALGIFTTYAVSSLSVVNPKSIEEWDK